MGTKLDITSEFGRPPYSLFFLKKNDHDGRNFTPEKDGGVELRFLRLQVHCIYPFLIFHSGASGLPQNVYWWIEAGKLSWKLLLDDWQIMWRSGGNIIIQMNLEMELILNLFFLDLINAVHYLIDGYDKALLIFRAWSLFSFCWGQWGILFSIIHFAE